MEQKPVNVKELWKEFQQKKRELSTLRSNLNNYNKEKETAFQELRSVRQRTESYLFNIKKLKKERDQLTKEVKKFKAERDKLNKIVREKASAQKEVDEKKKAMMDQLKFKGDPSKIKAEINFMEQKLETEIIPFSKEQQLNKKIKELKVKYKKLEKLGLVWKEVNTVTADFAEQRRKAQESHQEVQNKAQESQERHEQINQFFEKVKSLRGEEQPLAENYLQSKVQFEQTKNKLEVSLKRINELAKLLDEKSEESFKMKVKQKTAEVREKIKKGKKLSTEDILAFQALK